MRPLKRPRRIALLIETSNAYGRGLLEGISAHMREVQNWSVYVPEQRRGGPLPQWIKRWRGDGVIARIENRATASCFAAARLPLVDVSAARLLPDVPWVETDDRGIAELAFQHLAERGFKQFAYCGDASFNWSVWRRDHFRKLAQAAGGGFHVQEFPKHGAETLSWDRRQRLLSDWVQRLPKPVGIFACYDILAQQLLEACRSADAAVPEEVAVLGVDNDELVCQMTDPPLSSVRPDARRTGYQAAALLDRLLDGESVGAEVHLMPPLGVVTRQSTDVLAIEDRHVADALRFIREHALGGITVADVLTRSPLSRRVFESRFRKLVGRTPHEELLRTRIARIKMMLAETDLPVASIAERAGYVHLEYMTVQFQKLTGMPPSRYRALKGRRIGTSTEVNR